MTGTDQKNSTQGARGRSGAVRYALVASDGRIVAVNSSAQYIGDLARRIWPDQEQDTDRTGKGWDVQVAGCE